jgi:hypothetical protein
VLTRMRASAARSACAQRSACMHLWLVSFGRRDRAWAGAPRQRMRGMTAPPATRSSHRHSERGSRPCGGPRASAHPRTRARCLRSARTHTSSGTSTVSALFALESWMHACHSRDRYPSLGCEDGEERAAEVEEEDHGREHAHHDQRCWRDGPQRCRDVRGRVAWQQRRIHINIIVLE